MLKAQSLKLLGFATRLWKYQLQLLASPKGEISSDLWTHTDPIEVRRRQPRSVRLDRHLKTESMEDVHQFRIKLEQGFAPGAHNKWAHPWEG